MNIDPGILALESKVGVKPGFFADLQHEDDWSFIIKLHALFEAACTHLLLFHFREPELSDVFSKLELSSKTTGKIAFLGKLGLLGKEERRFVSSLSELRNSLVHDVRNAQFDLRAMAESLDSSSLRKFAIDFSPWETSIRGFSLGPPSAIDSRLIEQARLENVIQRAKEDPKSHIWFGAYGVLVHIVDMHGYSDYKQWVKVKSLFADDDEAL